MRKDMLSENNIIRDINQV